MGNFKNVRSLVIGLLFGILLTGCGKQIENMIRSNPFNPGESLPDPPPYSTDNPFGQKRSPGANLAAGSQVGAQFAITTTKRKLSGTNIQAVITFSQNRPE